MPLYLLYIILTYYILEKINNKIKYFNKKNWQIKLLNFDIKYITILLIIQIIINIAYIFFRWIEYWYMWWNTYFINVKWWNIFWFDTFVVLNIFLLAISLFWYFYLYWKFKNDKKAIWKK